jgi:hypothetical protein
MAPKVVYLGYKINKQGIYPVAEKVTGQQSRMHRVQLRLPSWKLNYLGMFYYYNQFSPNVAIRLNLLHKVLQKNQKWEGVRSKRMHSRNLSTFLQSDKVLVHYHPSKNCYWHVMHYHIALEQPCLIIGGRKWASHFIRVPHIDRNREELLTIGERKYVHHIWHKEIPSIFGWAIGYHCDRSQTSYSIF